MKSYFRHLNISYGLILLLLLVLIAVITAFQITQKQKATKKTRAKQKQTEEISLTYPTDRWQRIWYDDSEGAGGGFLQGQKPDASIKMPMGSAGDIHFDQDDNMIVQDHTWPRVWVINLNQDSSWLVPVSDYAISPTTPGPIDFYGQKVNLLKLFAQKNYGQISENTPVANKIHHAPGVTVDRSVTPNRIYVVDSGNNRVLGFENIDTQKSADIIFGQPANERPPLSAACNRDAYLGINKNPDRDTLCFIDTPIATNMGEYWMRHNIDVDKEGNLYVLDMHNNRVLKYNQPFSTDKSDGKGDALTDFVIGQDDFTSGKINKGKGKEVRDESSIWTGWGADVVSARGVSVDNENNVWVADTFNRRVLRFPPGSNKANLVLGQADFSSSDSITCGKNPRFSPLNRMCAPTLAKIHPETGDLYVIDEYPAFKARILLFKPPFTNGKPAEQAIFANQDVPMNYWGNQGVCSDYHLPKDCNNLVNCYWRESDKTCYERVACANYQTKEDCVAAPATSYCYWDNNNNTCYYSFRASGFAFNTLEGEYAKGVLWVNENERTILIDDNDEIIKTIGVPDKSRHGCDAVYLNKQCGKDLSQNFNLCWPGGSIGIDNDNNIYLADERYNRVSRFALPYNIDAGCIPDANGGLFSGTEPNAVTPYGIEGSVGVFAFENQLIVSDHERFLVWNNYLNKKDGDPADLVIGQPSAYTKEHNLYQLSGGTFYTTDDQKRLWFTNGQGRLIVFNVPFNENSQPLANHVRLYWADNRSEVDYSTKSVVFDKYHKKIWISDGKNNRLLRISDYQHPENGLTVDAVIGQPNKESVCCNQAPKDEYGSCVQKVTAGLSDPKANSLCKNYQIEFDNFGNLFVIENNYEGQGNVRVSVFLAADLAAINPGQGTVVFPLTEAKKVFIRNSLTEPPGPGKENEPHSPVTLAFNSKNQMILGNDGYYSGSQEERYLKQLWFYDNPLQKTGSDYLGSGPDETNVQFNNNWGEGELAYGKSDHLHFASSRKIHFDQEGIYKFTLASDDDARVRLWIDDKLKIDNWKELNYGTDFADIPLAAGDHNFRIDYYEKEGKATVAFFFLQIGGCAPIYPKVSELPPECDSSTEKFAVCYDDDADGIGEDWFCYALNSTWGWHKEGWECLDDNPDGCALYQYREGGWGSGCCDPETGEWTPDDNCEGLPCGNEAVCNGLGQCVCESCPTPTLTPTPIPQFSLKVLAPNGGEVWFKEGTYTIKWKFEYPEEQSPIKTTISLRKEEGEGRGGREVLRITNNASTIVGENQFSWKIPNNINNDNYRIVVVVGKDFQAPSGGWGHPHDMSDQDFTITISPTPTPR